MPEGLAINAEERKEIDKVFNKLYRKIRPRLKDNDGDLLKKAYHLAITAHDKQRRKSGEPYILHPIEVARICYEEIGLGPTAVTAAILHDVVEDTDVTLNDIEGLFGAKITKIVDGLTKLDGLYNVESPQAENFKKVLSTLVEDVRVVLIKMADRIHNLRTIDVMPKHKQLKIAAETMYIYAPLAHRLGIYNLKTEFHDICMKITDTETYNDIKTKLEESETDRTKYIRNFLRPIKKGLRQMEVDHRVTARVKAISSIANKIKKKKIPFEEIYDIFAVRIIVNVPQVEEKSTCWQVYSLITDNYKPIPERLKDWVTTPKGNGYESLHTTVIGPKGRFIEVQIRSERMDEIAEKGFAAHWKYKEVQENGNIYDRWLANVRDILDTQHTDALEFLNDFKTNLFSEEIYAFTPKGDMKILPKGATALDFAFDIHSDVGYQATAIKVNNKLVPMGYKLQNGDQVSVTTSKNQKPTENWLKIVVTGKARSKIRSAMKEERRKQGELGKEALMRKLKNMKVNFEDNVDMLVKYFGLTSRPDLYYALSMGSLKVSELKAFDVVANNLVLKQAPEGVGDIAPKDEKLKSAKSTNKKAPKSRILVNGESADMYEFSLATCCNPVMGDAIFGYLTATKGLKIHRTNCPNSTHIMANYGYRILKAEWVGNIATNFHVDLLIIGVDSGIGVIQDLVGTISDKLGINIRSFNIDGREGYFEAKISVVVLNKDQLVIALKTLKGLENVTSVTRLDKSSS